MRVCGGISSREKIIRARFEVSRGSKKLEFKQNSARRGWFFFFEGRRAAASGSSLIARPRRAAAAAAVLKGCAFYNETLLNDVVDAAFYARREAATVIPSDALARAWETRVTRAALLVFGSIAVLIAADLVRVLVRQVPINLFLNIIN